MKKFGLDLAETAGAWHLAPVPPRSVLLQLPALQAALAPEHLGKEFLQEG